MLWAAIFWSAIGNAMTGRKMLKKHEFAMLMGLLVLFSSWQDALFIAVATYAWRALGPGKYFMAIHGNDMRHEKEHPVADTMLAMIEGKRGRMNNRLYGVIGMSLRWTVDALPLALWYHTAWPLLLLLSGPSYWAGGRIASRMGKDYSVLIGEILTGIIYGLIISLILGKQ
jgi:hypothetical protein